MSTSNPQQPSDLRLGWIGLGSMGLAMAINIQTHIKMRNASTGGDITALRYTNRTMSRGDVLMEIGGVPCKTVVELSRICDVVFISVSNDEVLTATIKDILSSGRVQGKIIVDTTTVHPSTSAKMSELLVSAGASYISAPVFGATPIAQSGQLLVAAAGPSLALQTISPFLKGVIARSVIIVGEEPSKALLLKTTSNFITAGLMYLISEAHVLSEKSGLPTSVLEALIQENFGAYAYGVSKRMTQGVYYPAKGEAPFSGLELGIKDVGHGLGVAKDMGMELKLGELAMECMTEAKILGDERGKKMDSSSMYGIVRQNAGLPFETAQVKQRDAEREDA